MFIIIVNKNFFKRKSKKRTEIKTKNFVNTLKYATQYFCKKTALYCQDTDSIKSNKNFIEML